MGSTLPSQIQPLSLDVQQEAEEGFLLLVLWRHLVAILS